MQADSRQHTLDRVRRPRVQITYDVETNGAMRKVELPFVIGVLADLSGMPKDPLKPIKERLLVTKALFQLRMARMPEQRGFRA